MSSLVSLKLFLTANFCDVSFGNSYEFDACFCDVFVCLCIYILLSVDSECADPKDCIV